MSESIQFINFLTSAKHQTASYSKSTYPNLTQPNPLEKYPTHTIT